MSTKGHEWDKVTSSVSLPQFCVSVQDGGVFYCSQTVVSCEHVIGL